jgi:hypothetical protein
MNPQATLVSAVFGWEKHSAPWRQNILRALRSWLAQGFAVVYCSQPIPDLQLSASVSFTGDNDFPEIKKLLDLCALQPGLVGLLDADLALGPGIFDALKMIDGTTIALLVSKRWTYDPATGIVANAQVLPDDHAFDFFLGDASLFSAPARLIGPGTRVAHNLWDSWLIGYFNLALGSKVRSATKFRFLFHPRHAERSQPFGTADFVHDKFAAAAGDPAEL